MLKSISRKEKKLVESGALYERLIYDPKFLIESLISIVDKEKRVVPFIFNPAQDRYYLQRTLRDIILKPRQLGFSTEIMALFLQDTMFVPNTTSLIVAQTTDDAMDLFKRAKFMFESIPEVFRPHVKLNNQKQLFFDKINSTFFIGSAEAKDFGRSKVINNLHCSELSHPYWKEELLTGLFESVPHSGRIVIESTARGEGGPFHEYYMKAKERKNEFKNYYYRWYEHAEYRLPLLPNEKLVLDEDELDLIPKIRASNRKFFRALKPKWENEEKRKEKENRVILEQLKWRREKKSRLGKKFIQEYPELEDEDAFIKSGSPVFAVDQLKMRDKELPDQLPVEIWLGGDLFIYKIADPGARYVIGADTSEGNIDSDFSAAMVLKSFPPPIEQVALLHGRWTPDVFSEKIWKIGMAYNKATIAVERNNHGHAVLLNLVNGIIRQGLIKYPAYPQVFVGPDKKFGWLTSASSKPQMLEELDRAIRSGELVINSKQFINEARKFNYLGANKMGASIGEHDDIVMAMAIALIGIVMGKFDFSF
jgi:hypothetical protein